MREAHQKEKSIIGKCKVIGMILFILYLLLVIYVMFLADSLHRTNQADCYRYNLEPFREIHRFPNMWKAYGAWVACLNLFGNVIAFMPLGFFVPLHVKKYRKCMVTVAISFLFSLLIECTQLVSKVGVFDVDDLMLNTFGGFLGYICFAIAFHIYKIYNKKSKKRGIQNEKKTTET